MTKQANKKTEQDIQLARAISNKNVLTAEFEYIEFDGDWLATIGRPERAGTWTIWGTSGSGKTTFTLALCKYLAKFKKVIYLSLEQSLTASMQTQWRRANMVEAGTNVKLLKKEPISHLKARLRKRKAPEVVIIDSMTCLIGFTRKSYLALITEFPTTLFIFIAHEKHGDADPPVAETVRRLSDVKLHVKGFTAYPVTRFPEGGKEFIIWEEGAHKYKAMLEDLELNK